MTSIRASILVLLLAAAGAPRSDSAPASVRLLNVELTDTRGVKTQLAGFHRVSAEHRFRGYLGAAAIDVPYSRVREMRLRTPERPGARPRVDLTLRSGRVVKASFDEREADQLFVGFAWFGKYQIFFRDLRHLRILGPTARKDLPVYGVPATGVDVAVTDREGVRTQLVRFRRAAAENALPGVLGNARITIPIRLVKDVVIRRDDTPGRDVTLTARDGRVLRFRIPTYEEETVFAGDADFGTLRIDLGELRRIEVFRVTPVLRDLDPVKAAGVPREQDADEPPPAR